MKDGDSSIAEDLRKIAVIVGQNNLDTSIDIVDEIIFVRVFNGHYHHAIAQGTHGV